MTIPTYSTGTISVAADGTTVTGVGPLWLTTGNAKSGDWLVSGHFGVKIVDVVDETHLTITPWPGGTLAGAAYTIYKESTQRIVGASAAEDVDELITALNTSGWFIFVRPEDTVPDPSLGRDGQYAMQPTTGKQWVRVSGAWTYQGIYKGFRMMGAWSGATAYVSGDVVTLSGSSYVCIADHTNHTPPNVTYWQLLASKGDPGPTGSAGANGTNGAGYGGTSTTSLAIGTGTKVFTTQAGLAYGVGARVRASYTSDPTNYWMEGVVTAYSGTSLTLSVDATKNTATWANWTFNLAGEPGASGGVSNFAIAPGGRITLASGVPRMTTSQAGKGTVYYTPYVGNLVPIYDGTNMAPTAFSELSQATTDATKSPAAVAASKVYDLFVWNDGGTLRCTRGPAWSSLTARGYTLTSVNGVLLNTSAITNGPGALRGTWVGTIASNASSLIDWILPSAGSGGVAGVLNVCNAYNKVNVAATVVDSGASYTYSGSAVRQMRGSAGNQISFVSCSTDDDFVATLNAEGNTVAVTSATLSMGVGLDSVSAISGQGFQIFNYTAGSILACGSVSYAGSNLLGVHTFSMNEKSDGTNNNNINNASANNMVLLARM